jgi:hypothetical protein
MDLSKTVIRRWYHPHKTDTSSRTISRSDATDDVQLVRFANERCVRSKVLNAVVSFIYGGGDMILVAEES